MIFFAGIGLLILGAAADTMAVIVLGGVLVLAAGLWGMFYGEKAANELSQGPGRRRRR